MGLPDPIVGAVPTAHARHRIPDMINIATLRPKTSWIVSCLPMGMPSIIATLRKAARAPFSMDDVSIESVSHRIAVDLHRWHQVSLSNFFCFCAWIRYNVRSMPRGNHSKLYSRPMPAANPHVRFLLVKNAASLYIRRHMGVCLLSCPSVAIH